MACIKDNNEEKDLIKDETTEEIDLQETLKLKEKEILELNDNYLRLKADFMNYKRRTETEKANLISYGIESFVCELLPTIDSLEKALEIEDGEEASEGLYKGVEMIHTQIKTLLSNNGVEEIEALGSAFDPNMHHAVVMEESSQYEEGIVTNVIQKGYKIKDKVIRPSMVIVSK